MQTFSFNPPMNLSSEKWLLTVTSFEATNSVFNITNENSSFSITIPGHWNSISTKKTNDELDKLLELRSENDIEMHVNQLKKKGSQIKIGDIEYELSDFDTKKNEIVEELKKCKIH